MKKVSAFTFILPVLYAGIAVIVEDYYIVMTLDNAPEYGGQLGSLLLFLVPFIKLLLLFLFSKNSFDTRLRVIIGFVSYVALWFATQNFYWWLVDYYGVELSDNPGAGLYIVFYLQLMIGVSVLTFILCPRWFQRRNR